MSDKLWLCCICGTHHEGDDEKEKHKNKTYHDIFVRTSVDKKRVVIWVCDTCGKQCKSNDEVEAHKSEMSSMHNLYTPIPVEEQGYQKLVGIELKASTIDNQGSILATVIGISDEVLDKIADRVIKKLG